MIGPDSGAQAQVADALRAELGPGYAVKAGAGPDARPDVVVAAVGAPTAEDVDVVQAVAESQGLVVVFVSGDDATSASPWPTHPGWLHAGSIQEVAELVAGLGVDMHRWESDAHRADNERQQRVGIAIRLASNRLAHRLVGEPGAPPPAGPIRADDVPELHAVFCAGLREAVLEQGVAFPSVDTSLAPQPEEEAAPVWQAVEPWAWLSALVAGAGMGALTWRLTGALVAALLVGLVVAGLSVAARWWSRRAGRMELESAQQCKRLRESWARMVADVISRLHIPRVADTLTHAPTTLRTT
ncbi:MAG TPA: hypothetical protein H9867_05055 [Candidatus Corynebacterium gallistercoris]|uniref:Uncharacterized protein n=1 Tax=Candidatus Corynebacterium gallistercoris TaxID=2838530 RepID=A0A9D1RY16_9CORY|nr:hypothetical protein [Candidatus Corynebacterium gallistercoris]